MAFCKAVLFLSVFFIGVLLSESTLSSEQNEKEIVIRIHCWNGYAKPYVENFKRIVKEKYGKDIHINVSNVSKPSEFWELSRSKKVDLISPAHNIIMSPTWSFVNGNVVLPIDVENIPNYKHLLSVLKKNSFVIKNGNIYGVPYVMGAYGLAYNTEKADAPESWDVLWKENSKRKYTITRDYADCNVYISALVLGAGYDILYDVDKLKELPSVGLNRISRSQIQNSLIQKKLSMLSQNAYSLWEGTADPDEFNQLTYAATWGYAVHLANKRGLKWKMAKPREGTVKWLDHWVITYAVKDQPFKKKLCEAWINYCLSPKLQVGVVRNWGAAPVVENIESLLTREEVQMFNVNDKEYWNLSSFWKSQNKRTTNIYDKMWENALKLRAPPIKHVRSDM